MAVAVLAALVLLPALGAYTLWDPDEGRHAEVAREMLAATSWRGWIVPSYDFRAYHDKPALFYWAVSAASAVGGVNERSARLVPATAALLTVLAVYLWAAAVWEPLAGLAAATVLLTAGEFVALGRYVTLDMVLTLWITLGLLAVERWSARPAARGWLYAAAAAAALGALTKGLVAPGLIGGVGLAALVALGRLRVLQPRPLAVALGVFVVLAVPWYVAAGVADPGYLREFLLTHHVERFLGGEARFHPRPAYFPWAMLAAGFLPWSVLLPATLRGTLARARRGGPEVFCAVWSLGVLLFFTLSHGKLGTYILPALPPLALLTGRYLLRLREAAALPPAERWLVHAGVAALGLICLVAPLGLYAASARLYDAAWVGTSRLALVGPPLGAVLLALVWRRRCDLLPVALPCGMLLVIAVFYRLAAPEVSAVVSEAPIAWRIAAVPGATRAPIVAYDVRAASLLFYLGRPVHRLTNPAKLRRVLVRRPLVFVVSSPRHEAALEATGRLYPWLVHGRHVLYASRPPDGPLITAPGAPPGGHPDGAPA